MSLCCHFLAGDIIGIKCMITWSLHAVLNVKSQITIIALLFLDTSVAD